MHRLQKLIVYKVTKYKWQDIRHTTMGNISTFCIIINSEFTLYDGFFIQCL